MRRNISFFGLLGSPRRKPTVRPGGGYLHIIQYTEHKVRTESTSMRAEGFVHPKPCAVAQARGPQGDGGDALAFRQSPKFRVPRSWSDRRHDMDAAKITRAAGRGD